MDSPASSLQKFLSIYQLDKAQLSESTGIKSAAIRGILENKTKITPEIELRLSRYFKTEELYWINLQIKNEISALKKNKEFVESLKQISRAKMPKEPKVAAKTGKTSNEKTEEPKTRGRKKAEEPVNTIKEQKAKPRGRPPKKEGTVVSENSTPKQRGRKKIVTEAVVTTEAPVVTLSVPQDNAELVVVEKKRGRKKAVKQETAPAPIPAVEEPVVKPRTILIKKADILKEETQDE
ncbi:MAG: hypothetical protein LBQ88_14795 [Treponema sp.]|nr:hypothetical protein [Treponema sp.]